MQFKVTREQMAMIIKEKLDILDQDIETAYLMKDYAKMNELRMLFSSYYLVLKHYTEEKKDV